MCKNITLALISSVFTLILSITILFHSIIGTLTNSSNYKDALQEADAYNSISAVLQEDIKREVNNDENSNQKFGQLFLTNLFTDLSSQILNGQTLQTTIERNIDNIFKYLNSDDKDLIIYLPFTQIRTYIKESVKNVAVDTVNSQISTLPTCTPSQEKNFKDFDVENVPECVPSALKTSGITIDQIIQNDQSLDESFDKVLANSSFNNFQDTSTLNELVNLRVNIANDLDATSDNTQSLNNPQQNFDKFREGYRRIKLVEYVLLAIDLLFLIIVILINLKTLNQSTYWLGSILLISGLLTFTLSKLSYLVYDKFVPRILDQVFNTTSSDLYKDLFGTTEKFVHSLFRILTNNLTNVSLWILAVGASIILIGIIWKYLKKNSRQHGKIGLNTQMATSM